MSTTPAGPTLTPPDDDEPLTINFEEDVAIARWKTYRFWFTIAGCIAVAMLFGILFLFSNKWWIAVPISGYALYEFFRLGWEDIKFPDKWMPMIFECPLNVLINWGVYFFPFKNRRLLYFYPVPGQEQILEFTVPMRIPDNCEIEVPFFLYFVVDESNPIQFYLAGGLATVKQKLQALAEEVLREFLASTDRGPKTLGDARASTFETFNLVLEIFFTRDFARIDAAVPTEILIRFFDNRLTKKEQGDWKDYLDGLASDQARQSILKKKVQARRQLVEDAKVGKIKQGKMLSFGIIATRIGLKNIEPYGKTEEGVDEAVRATFTAQAKETLSDSIRKKIEELKPVLGGDAKEAAKAVRVQYGVATEKIEERQFSSDAATLQGIVEIVQAFMGRKS